MWPVCRAGASVQPLATGYRAWLLHERLRNLAVASACWWDWPPGVALVVWQQVSTCVR